MQVKINPVLWLSKLTFSYPATKKKSIFHDTRQLCLRLLQVCNAHALQERNVRAVRDPPAAGFDCTMS